MSHALRINSTSRGSRRSKRQGRLHRHGVSQHLPAMIKLTMFARGTFRPDRVRAVADRFGVDGQMALENVLYARAWSSEQQCELLVDLATR
jgi:hypothetical protein